MEPDGRAFAGPYRQNPTMLKQLIPFAACAAIVASTFGAPLNASPGISDPDSRACLACHSSVEQHSHPLGVAAQPALPLPLTRNGTVGCKTCHKEPNSTSRHALTGRGAGLRLESSVLCRTCHTGAVVPGSTLAHGLRLGLAHLVSRPTDGVGSGFGLDLESTLCLSCHDGGLASSAGVRVVTSPGWRGQGGLRPEVRSMHPVGIDYIPGPEIARVRDLPPGVRLFSGKVGCGSCHSVYSEEPQMLSLENRASTLCLACHLK